MRNLIPLALAAAALFVTAKLHLTTHWIGISIEQIVVLSAALILAFWMHTRVAFAILSVLLAPIVVELVAHLVYGIQCVQGGVVHMSLIATATVAVLLGLATKRAGANAGPDANAV